MPTSKSINGAAFLFFLSLNLFSISVKVVAAPDIYLLGKKSDASWKIGVENPDAQAVLLNDKVKAPIAPNSSAPSADVSVERITKKYPSDALAFSWKDSWRSALTFTHESPVDLRPYEKGVVSFDLKIDELSKGGVSFKLSCGKDCDRLVPYLAQAKTLIGKGWQSIAVPVQCFIHDGDDMSAVATPFALETGGAGRVAIANVKIKSSGKANVTCPDYKTLSVTPAMLDEWWSMDWWLPRHEKKLQDIKSRPIDLVFIGDSITEGWEKSGVPVWQKYYANRNAIALGFGGDRTENILWRLQHGEVDEIHPKVAVLMFGTNNTGFRHEDPALTARGVKRVLDELRQRLPETKLLLLAIFPRGEKPDDKLREINEQINSRIAEFADNKSIFFLNINKVFLDDQGMLSKTIMPDLLHPNEKGYELWANTMEPELKKLMQEQ